jgi:hypothetical protein
MKSGLLLIVAVALVIAVGCSSGKKAYERGDYYAAVMKAIQRLRQNPDHSKSQDALQSAYPLAVEFFETQANNEIASNSPFKWKNAIQSYTSINQMYEQIRQCPGCMKVVMKPKNYYAEIAPMKEKAAEESYNAGINSLMKGTRNDAKTAYYNFTEAQQFVPGYKDVLDYIGKAKDVATLKVVVQQMPVVERYNFSSNFFQDKIEAYLHQNYPDQGFVKFLTPQEAQNINLQSADHIVTLKFDDFSVGNTSMKEKEETVSKDSVKVGETKIEGKTIPVYNTVKAKLNTYRKEVVSTGLLSMKIIDAKTDGVLTHKKFTGEFAWVNTWARFNGDERALTNEHLAMVKRKEEQPPAAQELFLEFTKPIYNQLIPAIKDFYQPYQ